MSNRFSRSLWWSYYTRYSEVRYPYYAREIRLQAHRAVAVRSVRSLQVDLGLLALPVSVFSQRIGRAGRVRGRTAVFVAVVVITADDNTELSETQRTPHHTALRPDAEPQEPRRNPTHALDSSGCSNTSHLDVVTAGGGVNTLQVRQPIREHTTVCVSESLRE